MPGLARPLRWQACALLPIRRCDGDFTPRCSPSSTRRSGAPATFDRFLRFMNAAERGCLRTAGRGQYARRGSGAGCAYSTRWKASSRARRDANLAAGPAWDSHEHRWRRRPSSDDLSAGAPAYRRAGVLQVLEHPGGARCPRRASPGLVLSDRRQRRARGTRGYRLSKLRDVLEMMRAEAGATPRDSRRRRAHRELAPDAICLRHRRPRTARGTSR